MPVKAEAFLDIESSLADRLYRGWQRESKPLLAAIWNALEGGDKPQAVLLANGISLRSLVEKNADYIDYLSHNAILFGATRVTPNPRETSIVGGNFDDVLDQSKTLLTKAIRQNVEDWLRFTLLESIAKYDLQNPATNFTAPDGRLADYTRHVVKYDPSQPRDDDGRWTDGGGSGGATEAAPGTPGLAGQDAGRHPGGTAEGIPATYRRGNRGLFVRVAGSVDATRWTTAPGELTALNARGFPAPDYLELHGPQAARAFSEQITAAKNASKAGAAVYVYSDEDYASMRLFVTHDGNAGFAVKPDGDIVSLFNKPGGLKGVALSALHLAVQAGGRKLDAFDTVLPGIYANANFTPVARLKWDDSQAPAGWDKATFIKFNGGEPDVVFMVFDPKRNNRAYEAGEGPHATSYDEAVSLQERRMVRKGGPGSGNFGHAGRPGQVGGSARDGSSPSEPLGEKSPPPPTGTYDKPQKDKPITMVFGGSFNPPHAGHRQAIEGAVKAMEAQGYRVANVIVSPTADKLLAKKLGAKAYPLEDRVQLTALTMEGTGFIVTGEASLEAEHFEGKLRRTQLADWARKQHPDTTVVAVTGEDAAPGSPPKELPAVYAGDPGTSHEGYYYLSMGRAEESISSSKIRAQIKAGEPPSDLHPDVVTYLQKMFERKPHIEKMEWWPRLFKFDEAKHPRVPEGPHAGEFTSSVQNFSESLGIRRKDMPQIRGKDMAEFAMWAERQGVAVTPGTAVVSSLKPAQSEYNARQAAQMTPDVLSYPLTVSADDYVFDGTNRFVAIKERDPSRLIEVRRIDLPAKEALQLMHRFPKAFSKDVGMIGATVEKKWDEEKHPRNPAGSEHGGEFTSVEQLYIQARKEPAYVALEQAHEAANKAMDAKRQSLLDAKKAEIRAKFAGKEGEFADFLNDKNTMDNMATHMVLVDPNAFEPEATNAVRLYSEKEQFLMNYVSERMPKPSPYAEEARQRNPQTDTPEFKAWFGDSKVVDDSIPRRPLVVFHGTTEDIEGFDTTINGDRPSIGSWCGPLGTWFAGPIAGSTNYDPGNAEFTAGEFAKGNEDKVTPSREGSVVYPVYLSIKKPMEFDSYEELQEEHGGDPAKYRDTLIKKGYDGVVIRNSDTDGGQYRDDWVAFHPEQIKSAIGNVGAFDPKSKNITKAEWNEHEHPRDDHGRFAASASDEDIQRTFDAMDELPRSDEIQELEQVWAGGVADFGDPDAAYAVQSADGYDYYKAGLEKILARELGDEFTVYRFMSKDQHGDWQAGADVGPIAVSLDKGFATSFNKFAGFDQAKAKDRVLVAIRATPASVVMMGKREESELVLDANSISFSETKLIQKAEWDESLHPRDREGQFTSGGAGMREHARLPAGEHKPTEDDIHAELRNQRIPAGEVTISYEDKKFKLGDAEYDYAGAVNLESKQMTLYPNKLTLDSMPGIVAHEVMHVRFATAWDAMQEESKVIREDKRDIMRPDGSIRDGTHPADKGQDYTKEFPAHVIGFDVHMAKLQADDGVSDYSEKWWKEQAKDISLTYNAIHETLAEMHRLKFEHGNAKHTKVWETLYRSTNRIYAKVTGRPVQRIGRGRQKLVAEQKRIDEALAAERIQQTKVTDPQWQGLKDAELARLQKAEGDRVFWFDAKWNLCDQSEAVIGKVVFSDGSNAFINPVQSTAKWDEEKHPRDEKGRWAAMPGAKPSAMSHEEWYAVRSTIGIRGVQRTTVSPAERDALISGAKELEMPRNVDVPGTMYELERGVQLYAPKEGQAYMLARTQHREAAQRLLTSNPSSPESIAASLREAATTHAARQSRIEGKLAELPEGHKIGKWSKQTVGGDVFWTNGKKFLAGRQLLEEVGSKGIAEHIGEDEVYKWDEEKHPRDKEGQFTVAGVSDLPPEPGTTPIPEGHVRLYHQTHEENALAIAESGLLFEHAKGIEGPKGLYASETGFYGKPGDRPTIEFSVPKDRWIDPFVVGGDVTPQEILAVHLPWHDKARYIEGEGNAKVLANVLAGQHDNLEGDYAKAITYIKSKHGAKKWDEAAHPRDAKGMFTEGAGIEGLPKSVSLAGKDFYQVQEAIERGGFNMRVKDVREGWGEKTYVVAVAPKIPEGWVQAKSGRMWYDPTYATEDEDGYVVAKDKATFDYPADKEPGHIFRGMSQEEFQQSMERGHFATRGGYNLGTEQEGLTYYSTDVAQAAHYASGFAPWQYAALPDRPAVVIKIKDPGGHVKVQGTGATEVGLPGTVPASAVTEVYEGKPFIIRVGNFEVIAGARGWPDKMGSSTGVSTSVRWEKVARKYDESQPRDPKGSATGGQWSASVRTQTEGMTFNQATKLWEHPRRKVTARENERLRAFPVPPAWVNVHLNPDETAPLQVLGQDAAGRWQPKYSVEHTKQAALAKFARGREYNEIAPRVTEQIERDMANPEKVNEAAAMRLIQQTGIRIGGEKGEGVKHTAIGASTLKGQHVKVDGDKITLSFTGKSAVRQHMTLTDPKLASYLRGRNLQKGELVFDTTDAKMRDYFKSVAGDQFIVKDVRTWVGTATAIKELAKLREPKSVKEFKDRAKIVATKVSKVLGNTPAMAMKSYIDPLVWQPWNAKFPGALEPKKKVKKEDMLSLDEMQALLDEYYALISFDGELPDWRDVPETALDPDDDEDDERIVAADDDDPLDLRKQVGEVEQKAETSAYEQGRAAAQAIVRPFVSFRNEANSEAEKMLQLVSTLHTSRLSAFGFVVEAEVTGVTTYAISAQLDNRVCPVCEEMHGKEFSVADAADAIDDILKADEPDDLRTLQPWPSQRKQDVAEMAQMSEDELVDRNWHLPPYHPNCRCLLVKVEDVHDITQTPSWRAANPSMDSVFTNEAVLMEALSLDEAIRIRSILSGAKDGKEVKKLWNQLKSTYDTEVLEAVTGAQDNAVQLGVVQFLEAD